MDRFVSIEVVKSSGIKKTLVGRRDEVAPGVFGLVTMLYDNDNHSHRSIDGYLVDEISGEKWLEK